MESNRKRIAWGGVVFVAVWVLASGIIAAESPKVPFPGGYRSWQTATSVSRSHGPINQCRTGIATLMATT